MLSQYFLVSDCLTHDCRSAVTDEDLSDWPALPTRIPVTGDIHHVVFYRRLRCG